MVNGNWLNMFQNSELTNITTPILDHTAILLRTEVVVEQVRRHQFWFENKWLSEPDLSEVVRKGWLSIHNTSIMDRFLSTSKALNRWARSRNLEAKIDKQRWEEVIRRYEYANDPAEVLLLNEAKKNLGSLLLKEEIYWKQRAKQFWLKEGDKNTRFFNNMANARRKVKEI